MPGKTGSARRKSAKPKGAPQATRAIEITALDNSEAPITEAVTADEVLVDGYVGVHLADGIARFNLVANRYDVTTGKPTKVIVKRLAMGLPAVIRFHQGLGDLLAQLERDGLVSRAEGEPHGKA